MSDDTRVDPLAVQAAIGCRALSAGGHDDFNQGQVSCRRPGADQFWIKSAPTGFDEAVPSDFLKGFVDYQQPVDKLAPPEIPLHQAVYEARPDVNGIVHSHARATLLVGALGGEILPIGHEGALLQGNMARFTLTSNTILDITVGREIAAAIGEGVGAFLVNHGLVVGGKSVRHAIVYALMLERACQLQLAAWQTGREITTANNSDVEAKRDFIFADLSVRSYWEHLRRKMTRLHPELSTW